MDLKARWESFWKGVSPKEAIQSTWTDLYEHYTASDRAYHTLDHIAQCLDQLDQARYLARSPHLIEVALWYHDVVYDSHAKDNEEQSADFALQHLRELRSGETYRNRVAELIMATKHVDTFSESQSDERLIVDIDLTGLGVPWEAYKIYSDAIRFEYQWVPIPEYKKGRVAVLCAFLDRPHIYNHRHFRGMYEVRARENLAREIAELSS